MSDVDTSSYPKAAAPPAQKSMLDTAQQLGTMERAKIGIDADKLALVNQQFQLMNKELSTMANDPSITKEIAAQRLTNFAKTYNMPPQVTQQMLGELNSAPSVPAFAQNAITRGMQTMEAVNWHYGAPATRNDGQTTQEGVVSNKPGFGGFRGVAPPVQNQLPPGTPEVDNNPSSPTYGQPRLRGSVPLPAGPGAVNSRPVVGGPMPQSELPVTPLPAPRPNTNLTGPGKTITGVDVQDMPVAPFKDRFTGGTPGGATGMSPLFDEGKKALTEDQAVASRRMMAIKPAAQALPLMQMPGFLSGPGTEPFTKAVAALKTWGILDTADVNDPTAIRQEVNKKLAAYVAGSAIAGRSDAAQALAERSSPDPKGQITQALVKLTKDAIIMDRVEAARPTAFKDKDLSKYGQHRATFPQSIDEKAFGLDLEPDGGEKIVNEMRQKLKSKNPRERAAAEKFARSLAIADEQGFYK